MSTEQECLEGLSDKGKKFAKGKIKEYQMAGAAIPYGSIHAMAKKKHP